MAISEQLEIVGATAALSVICTVIVEEWRYRRKARLHIAALNAAKELLNSKDWTKRSFDHIKVRLGGFEDDELRRILVAAGAVRFEGEGGKELWGLRSRNEA